MHIDKALNIVRHYIQHTIQKINMIFGKFIFKVHQGEICCLDVKLKIKLSFTGTSLPDKRTLKLHARLDVPELVREALETLMLSKFGRILVDIRDGIVKAVRVRSDFQFTDGAKPVVISQH